jgi:hypothetical protein
LVNCRLNIKKTVFKQEERLMDKKIDQEQEAKEPSTSTKSRRNFLKGSATAAGVGLAAAAIPGLAAAAVAK